MENMNNEKKPYLVIYHAKCKDGFGAFVAATMKLGEENVEGYYANYRQPRPEDEVLKGRDLIYIVDFSYDGPTLLEMAKIADCKIVVIDHHEKPVREVMKYSEELKAANVECYLSPENLKSGAMLTWDYFNPEGPEAPVAIRHIDDRDRWQWLIPGSREFHERLGIVPMEYKEWESVFKMGDGSYSHHQFIEEGKVLMTKSEVQIDEVLGARMRAFNLDGYQVLAVNASAMFTSDVGNRLSQKFDVGMVYWLSGDGTVGLGLRSDKEGRGNDAPRANDLCQKFFNGDGHHHAAGGQTTIEWLQANVFGPNSVEVRYFDEESVQAAKENLASAAAFKDEPVLLTDQQIMVEAEAFSRRVGSVFEKLLGENQDMNVQVNLPLQVYNMTAARTRKDLTASVKIKGLGGQMRQVIFDTSDIGNLSVSFPERFENNFTDPRKIVYIEFFDERHDPMCMEALFEITVYPKDLNGRDVFSS